MARRSKRSPRRKSSKKSRSKRRSPKKSRSKRRSPKKSRSKRRSPRRKSPKKSSNKKYSILAYYTNETKLSSSNNITIIRQQGGTDNGKDWYVDAVLETPESETSIRNWLKSKPGFKTIAEFHLV